MSDQSQHCDPVRASKERRLFMVYGAISIALAVGFGYSMASIKYQDTLAAMDAKHQDVLADVSFAAARSGLVCITVICGSLGRRIKKLQRLWAFAGLE